MHSDGGFPFDAKYGTCCNRKFDYTSGESGGVSYTYGEDELALTGLVDHTKQVTS